MHLNLYQLTGLNPRMTALFGMLCPISSMLLFLQHVLQHGQNHLAQACRFD